MKDIFKFILALIVLSSLAGAAFLGWEYYQTNFAGDNNLEGEEQIDDRPLEVRVVKPERKVGNPFSEVTVISNKQFNIETNNRTEVMYIGEDNNEHYYIFTVKNIPQAGVEMIIKGSDALGNIFEQPIKIDRQAVALPAGNIGVHNWDDCKYVLDGDRLDAAVNRNNCLREDYAPDNLVDLNEEFGIYTLNNAELRADAGLWLDSMLKDLRAETGISDVTVVSGYRSFETQVVTYSGWVRSLGQQRADEISARPGHSEHQLGTTVDFSTVSAGYELSADFADTTVGRWLAENAESYGFKQLSDPSYADEPWHFRWFGVDQTDQSSQGNQNNQEEN